METITDLERLAAAHWRGTEEEPLGGWLLRAAGGFTGRANSALALGDPGVPLAEAIAAVTSWYRARGLPPMIAVPAPLAAGTARAVQRAAEPDSGLDEYLTERGWPTRQGAAFVMLADLPLGAAVPEIPADTVLAGSTVLPASPVLPADTTVRVSLEPDPAWAATYHYRGQDRLPPVALQVLTSAREQVFISLTAGDTVLAIARLSLDGGLAGLTAVEVHPAHRRHGLGRAITALACDMAARRGAGRAFLQVEIDNGPARALYESLGFRYSHRYQYRIAPGQ